MTGRRTVLQVGKYYPPVDGGIENHVHAVTEGLKDSYDITALVFNTSARTRREDMDGVDVVRVASLGRVLSTEISPSFFTWFLRLRNADVVHLHTPNPIGELACLAVPRRARLLVTYHSDVVRQKLLGRLNRLVLHRLMRRADRVITFTRRYMETSPVISRYADKCAIIPHGLDPSEVEKTAEVARMADELRQNHGPNLVLFVGRLVYYKGVDVLLKAVSAVPEAKLLIVGDGPMRSELEDLSRQLGLERRVTFLGHVSHERKIASYHACDFLVLPATHRSEAFGLVQIEAMGCGRPVICTDIDSGVPFVNRHGETGIVVPPGEPDALAEAMRRLLADESLRGRYGEAASRRVDELFSRRVMLRDLRALYRELMDTGRGAP